MTNEDPGAQLQADWRRSCYAFATDEEGLNLKGPEPGYGPLTPQQLGALKKIQTMDRNGGGKLFLGSGHNLGKDFFFCRVVVNWWMVTHVPTIVILTGPTDRQVKIICWSEMRRGITRGGPTMQQFEPKVSKTLWSQDEDWYVLPMTTKEDKRAGELGAKFSGMHGHTPLILVTEAAGFDPVFESQLDGILSTPGSMLIAYGQPQNPDDYLSRGLRNKDTEHLNWSCWDHPNVIEGRSIYPTMCGPRYPQDILDRYGDSSPIYESRVLGQTPSSSSNAIITGVGWRVALSRKPTPGQKTLGVDVARFGDDNTVICYKEGSRVCEFIVRHGQDTMATAGQVKRLIIDRDIPRNRVNIDDTGVGGGVTDRLQEQQFHVNGVVVGEVAEDPDRFTNKRGEYYWRVHEDFDPKTGSISLAEEWEDLRTELTNTLYGFDSKGRYVIESKAAFKERFGGRSPDWADSLMLTYATQEVDFSNIQLLPDCLGV